MKRILLSLGMLTFAGAAVIGGTGAFFSDQVTSEANVFTAGEVSLTAGALEHEYNGVDTNAPVFTDTGFSFNLADIKPLDEGTITYNLTNGSNEAYVCVMVDETGNDDNGVNSPETNAGDLSDGAGSGELGAFLNVAIGANTGSLASLSGTWFSLGTVAAGDPIESDIDYCFGEFDGSSCVLDEDAVYNLAQTDSLTADVSFYAVQSRNNDFSCDDLNAEQSVGNDDLFTADDRVGAYLSQDWFFYNDSADTIMGLNEFGPTGENEIKLAAGRDAAAMLLHDAGARYNIATYKFFATPLADIDSLKYTVYDESEGTSQTPYMHFNIDFDNSDTWQRRLVHVPGSFGNPGVPGDTWTEVDAIDGGAAMWYISGGTWPVGAVSEPGTTPGSTPKSWSDILAEYPTAALRTTDSFFGVRVGHPGPAGEESYVDSIEFDEVLYDFEN